MLRRCVLACVCLLLCVVWWPARVALAQNPAVTVSVDAAAARRPIKPARSGFTFTPTTRSITNLSGNLAAGAATSFTGSGP